MNARIGITQRIDSQTVDSQFFQIILVFPLNFFDFMNIVHGAYNSDGTAIFKYFLSEYPVPADAFLCFELNLHIVFHTACEEFFQFGNVFCPDRFPGDYLVPVICNNFLSGMFIAITICIRHIHNQTVFCHIVFIQNIRAAFQSKLVDFPLLPKLQFQFFFFCNVRHGTLNHRILILIQFQQL